MGFPEGYFRVLNMDEIPISLSGSTRGLKTVAEVGDVDIRCNYEASVLKRVVHSDGFRRGEARSRE